MKKVGFYAVFFFLAVAGAFGLTHALSGTTPSAITYVRNTLITKSAIGFSGNTGDYNKNFIDILPMHPTTGALDRTYWQLSGTSTLVSIPFVIYKNGTSNAIKAIGTSDGTLTTNNVWVKNFKSSTFSYSYDFKITANANSFANGTYTKTLRIRLWDNCTISTWTSAKTNITVDITVSLVVSGNTSSLTLSTGSLSFGEVTTNIVRTFTATVDSMQPYTLSMASANNYSLEYWNPLSSQIEMISGENVGYELVINSKTYSPTANPDLGVVANVPTVTTPVSNPYTGTITLKTVTAATAGDYKDTLTFTVSAP